jgi:hypothetical protein
MTTTDLSSYDLADAAWQGVNAAFAALGRVFICLDQRFRIVHASSNIDELLGPGSVRVLESVPIEAVLGPELFGPTGVLRSALQAGLRQERHYGRLRLAGGRAHPVSISVAPASHALFSTCRQEVTSVVVLEPLDEASGTSLERASRSGVASQPLGASRSAPADAIADDVSAPGSGSMTSNEILRLQDALVAHRWRRQETARALRISRSTLWRKMREAGLT